MKKKHHHDDRDSHSYDRYGDYHRSYGSRSYDAPYYGSTRYETRRVYYTDDCGYYGDHRGYYDSRYHSYRRSSSPSVRISF